MGWICGYVKDVAGSGAMRFSDVLTVMEMDSMGERAGYRVRQGDKVSHIFRKQWYIGGTKKELEELLTKVCDTLRGTNYQWGVPFPPINGNIDSALRSDLGIARVSAALFASLYTPPFDGIHLDERCDLSDHGIFEIELLSWDKWQLNHYKVTMNPDHDTVGPKKVVGEINVVKDTDGCHGKGLEFKWKGKVDL